MATLYEVQYWGRGAGLGTLYVGNGVVAGFDIFGGHYKGNYSEQGGRIRGTATLSMPEGGTLVTGQSIPAGQSVPVNFDWPDNLGGGQPLELQIMGQQVRVSFHKMIEF